MLPGKKANADKPVRKMPPAPELKWSREIAGVVSEGLTGLDSEF
jgi:hypothetical protein